MAHLEEQDFVLPHTGATMLDDRYAITSEERKNHCDLLRSRWGDSSIPK